MERIFGGTYTIPKELTEKQVADLRTGMIVMEAFWKAALELHWAEPNLLPRRRCVYSSCAVVDILHSIGIANATCFRSGFDLRMVRNGHIEKVITIGHPMAPKIEADLNAHLTVRVGDLIFDPAHAQLQAAWNSAPHYAAFLPIKKDGTIRFRSGDEASCLSQHVWSIFDREFKATFFKLARHVDLQTRRWRDAPDARPENRAAVVRRALELLPQLG